MACRKVPPEYAGPIRRYGPMADAEAKRWGLRSGGELLAKLLSGESGFSMGAVSSAGARAAAQFIPSTRDLYISRYGVDPWKDEDSAVKAAAIYMSKGGGLDSYNPGGGQGYLDYILGQDVCGLPKGAARAAGRAMPTTTGGEFIDDEKRSGALKGLLWVAFVLGGATLTLAGTSRLLGVKPPGRLPGKALAGGVGGG